MKRKILIIAFFVCLMLFVPITPVMSESEVNDNIEIEGSSERDESQVYRYVFFQINGYQLNHDGGVEITKKGRFIRDITFKNLYDCNTLIYYSRIPFRFWHHATEYTIESGRIEGFFGFDWEQNVKPPYLRWYGFQGYAKLFEIY